MTVDIADAVPQSVVNLWHQAQISHNGIAGPKDIEIAIRSGRSSGLAKEAMALAIQESSTWEMIDLMVDKVIDGRSLHALLQRLQEQGAIRRPDLVQWAEIFS